MKYALLIYGDPADNNWETVSQEERDAMMADYVAISNEQGTFGGAELQDTSTATTVRVRDGETLTTDGPFAETKEVLGGLYLIEAADLDAALAVAARVPAARTGGCVEVRPIVER